MFLSTLLYSDRVGNKLLNASCQSLLLVILALCAALVTRTSVLAPPLHYYSINKVTSTSVLCCSHLASIGFGTTMIVIVILANFFLPRL